jgi:hypothetical protein
MEDKMADSEMLGDIQSSAFDDGFREGRTQTLEKVKEKIDKTISKIIDFDCSKRKIYDIEYDDDNKSIAVQVLVKLKKELSKLEDDEVKE